MKKLLFFSILLTVLSISCTQNNVDKDNTDAVDPSYSISDTANTTFNENSNKYLWTAEINDNTGKLEMIKTRPINVDSLNATTVIRWTNDLYADVKLQFTKISGDTIYVKIPESTYLTQQMGSTGAEAYLANATYNLSELPNIKYVNVDFAAGDHAEPGVFSRSDFEKK